MRKYSAEDKIRIVEGYLNGEYSLDAKAHELGYNRAPGCFFQWVRMYQCHGPSAFIKTTQNNTYTSEFKQMVVEEYLSGADSAVMLSAKYNLRNDSVLLNWVKMYNANRELKDYCPNREVYMAGARRKTTIEERKEIVKYCIEHGRDYKGTANIYDVSYSQVYSWVKKYDSNGEDGLTDRRGRHKSDDEVDELERLRRENTHLKRQLQEKDMLAELLKKVQEFERM